MRTKELVEFIVARELVRVRKEQGYKKPWTKDPILQRYRFCNVHREDDTVTRWIAENWREPNKDIPDLWFAMAVARWNNHPDTLRAMRFPVPWSPDRFIEACHSRAAAGEKVWTGAYMIGTQGNAKDKAAFIAEDVLTPLWNKRATLRPRPGDTLASFAARVCAIPNQGTFMVGQMVADAKYATQDLLDATDWATWAVSGPGSRRGLNRIFDRPLNEPWREWEWKMQLDLLRGEVCAMLAKRDAKRPSAPIGMLHAQDLQNCLCEFDKYERVRLGEGKPRSSYPGV